MKRRLVCTLIAIVVILSLGGCAGNNGATQAPNQSAAPSSNGSSSSTGGSAAILPGDVLGASWPKDRVPAELPEYKKGAVTASGENGGVLTIKIKDTNKADLQTYLGALKSAGWIVTSDDTEAEAELGLYTVTFALQGSDDAILQIDVYTQEAGSWPKSELPPDVIPPETGTLVGKVEILNPTKDIWYFNYTYDGIDEAGARKYMEMLRKNGWEGDDTAVYKEFQWKGAQYSASIEIYETLETRTTFTCNFGL